jgi:hypothetical protein
MFWMPPALLNNLGRIPGNAFSAAAAQPWTIANLALFLAPPPTSPQPSDPTITDDEAEEAFRQRQRRGNVASLAGA